MKLSGIAEVAFLGVLSGALGACGSARRTRPAPVASAASSAPSVPTAKPTSSAVSSANVPRIAEAAVPPIDPDELRLRRSTLKSLARKVGPGVRTGVFDALLVAPDGEIGAIVEPASITAPTALRRPYAFYRLAVALEMRVVPAATLRGVSLDELGASFTDRDTTRELLTSFRVQNDGLVDVLFTSRSARSAGSPWDGSRGVPFDTAEGPPVSRWDVWASSPAEVPGEDAHLLHDYVELLVLDYLAGNVARQSAMRSGESAIVLGDNATAFPLHVEATSLDRLLRRLRAVARFPKGLRSALQRFDRAAAKQAFNGGPFETWLLSPRTLVELDERRAALLTLIEARVTERGEAKVLSL